jgi:hypothetical protein
MTCLLSITDISSNDEVNDQPMGRRRVRTTCVCVRTDCTTSTMLFVDVLRLLLFPINFTLLGFDMPFLRRSSTTSILAIMIDGVVVTIVLA